MTTEIPENIAEIYAYHCHVYFTQAERDVAVRLNDEIQDEFAIWDYRWLDYANELHPSDMFRFAVRKEDIGRFIPFLLARHEGLSVLLHGISGDAYVDHSYLTLWLGKQLELKLDRMREAHKRGEQLGETQVEYMKAAQDQAGKVRYKPGDDTHEQYAKFASERAEAAALS